MLYTFRFVLCCCLLCALLLFALLCVPFVYLFGVCDCLRFVVLLCLRDVFYVVFLVAVRCNCVLLLRMLFCAAVAIVGCLRVCDCLMLFAVCVHVLLANCFLVLLSFC